MNGTFLHCHYANTCQNETSPIPVPVRNRVGIVRTILTIPSLFHNPIPHSIIYVSDGGLFEEYEDCEYPGSIHKGNIYIGTCVQHCLTTNGCESVTFQETDTAGRVGNCVIMVPSAGNVQYYRSDNGWKYFPMTHSSCD